MSSNKRQDDRHHVPDSILPIGEKCCKATTGCKWDGSLKNVVTEPLFVQKVYDATLVNLQALSTVNNVRFFPNLPRGSRILRILDIRCKRFFNPSNIKDPRNLVIDSDTVLSGGEFLKDEKGEFIEVVGPDGLSNEKLIFADTTECDDINKGTPVFGTQRIRIRGNVLVNIELLILDSRDRKVRFTISANVPIAPPNSPIVLTNFFELCIPSIHNSAFFPRFTEFCNILCETRLATNSISRDIDINPENGAITIDLIIALCITCEKKIIVPVQLCVLSTGFPKLSPETSPICSTFPTLFPKQIDENSGHSDKPGCGNRPFRFSMNEENATNVMDLEEEGHEII